MTIFGTLAMVIGPAIAKAIFSSWLKDATLANAVSSEIVDTIKGAIAQRSERRKAQAEIELVGGQIAEALRLLADREAARVDESGRLAIGHALADTLRSANLTSELLVGFNLDQNRLTQHLSAAHPEATHGMSGEEQALYGRILIEASRQILEITPQLEDFALEFPREMLRRLDSTAKDVQAIRQQPQRAMSDFEKKYRAAVVEDLDRLETFGLPRMSRVTTKQRLSMAYIALSAARHSDEIRDRSAESIAEALSAELVATSRQGLPPHRHSQRVDQAMASCTRLVIRGDAGAGKSTLLQWLAVHAANRAFPSALSHWNLGIPFFIRLRSCVDRGFPVPEDFVQDIAKNFVARMPPGWVQQQLDDGALVLIDGVDELPRSQRDDLLSKLKRLVRDFPNARYIITSRPTGLKGGDGDLWQEWEEWAQEESFVNFTLEPMTTSGIEEFITRWHEALAAARRDEDRSVDLQRTGSNLQRLLRQRLDLRKLATNPLLCAMICALHRERGETLPAERTKLYDECIEMLLSRRDEARKIKLDETYPSGLSHGQKLEAIQSFAYWLMDNGYSSVEIERADAHFERLIPSLRLPTAVTGKQIRAFFVERASLLREPVIGRVDFMHRTFQEFLAAQEVLDVDKIGALLKHAHEDQWREVVILAAGLARPKEREELLKGLIKRGDERKTRRHYLHLLAVACLETAVRVSPEVSDAVISRVKALLPPKDDDEVALVAKAGNAIVPLLAPDLNYSENEASYCIDALAQIGTSAAMLMMANYAGDGRGTVVYALGNAWDMFDTADYAEIVLSKCMTLAIAHQSFSERVKYLEHLRELSLWDLRAQSLDSLSKLTNLTKLDLNGDPFDFNIRESFIYDLTPLSRLHQLTKLGLSHMEVDSLHPLTQLVVPHPLDMNHHSKKNSDLLPRLNLQTLYLQEVSVQDLEPIGHLLSLQKLIIEDDSLSDLTLLAKLRNLKTLFLPRTRVHNYSPLTQLKQLKFLVITASMSDQLDSLEQLHQLSGLVFYGYRITDIRPLCHLTNITFLSIGYLKTPDFGYSEGPTPITDLTPLVSLTKLTKLHISGTKVKDLSPIKHMTHLQLDARSTPELVEQWRSFGGEVGDIWADLEE
ncbi:MAG: NACHT domain-containing protein [Chloroflexi bacterium]|nr:NACHT domain-containing protein [Chloroflexota bacterium]